MSRGSVIYKARLNVAITPEQLEDVKQAATKVGHTLAMFVRTTILKEVRKIKKAA